MTNGCLFRSQGTTNIDPVLLSELEQKTTWPPILFSNITISAATNFSPVVARDIYSSPDFGYHYDPIDYIFGGVNANANVTFTTGTAVGWFELNSSDNGPGYGISLNDGVVATFNGTATSPCVFARYDTFQEGGNGLWMDKGWLAGIEDGGNYNQFSPSVVNATFTHFNRSTGDPNHIRDGEDGQPIVINATNCEIYGQMSGYNMMGHYTNCLFYRPYFGISTGNSYPYQILMNCTFYGGQILYGHSEGGAPYWYSYVHNCSFDNSTFSVDDPFGTNTAYADYNYNAFDQGADQWRTEGANTVIVTNGFNWETGWFGDFYLPTNSPLIQAGDRLASQVGLYHFTTQTNQVIDGSNIVDIGYHYVATDTNGTPLDTNGDGIPDYIEDANGNGLVDSGEIGWNLTNDLGLQVIILQPVNRSTLP